MVVGFEDESVTLSEPAPGQGMRVEMVCVVLTGSELTSQLRLQARFIDRSATGKGVCVCVCGQERGCVSMILVEWK